jgi:hypothetical protein
MGAYGRALAPPGRSPPLMHVRHRELHRTTRQETAGGRSRPSLPRYVDAPTLVCGANFRVPGAHPRAGSAMTGVATSVRRQGGPILVVGRVNGATARNLAMQPRGLSDAVALAEIARHWADEELDGSMSYLRGCRSLRVFRRAPRSCGDGARLTGTGVTGKSGPSRGVPKNRSVPSLRARSRQVSYPSADRSRSFDDIRAKAREGRRAHPALLTPNQGGLLP